MEDLITLPLEGLTEDSIIKVIGVGGGGCNAVNYMHRQGLKDVTFLVCNTDRQVLIKSARHSMTARRCCSSLPVWVAVQEPVLRP